MVLAILAPAADNIVTFVQLGEQQRNIRWIVLQITVESDNDLAVTLFSFPSLAAYETYRKDSMEDEECIAAYNLAKSTKCIIRYDRQFLRPILK